MNKYFKDEDFIEPKNIKDVLLNNLKKFKKIEKKCNYHIIPRLKDILNVSEFFKNMNIYFLNNKNIKQNKILYVEKNKILKFYVKYNLNENIIGLLLFIKSIDNKYKLKNFKLTKINTRFTPNTKIYYLKTFGTSFNNKFCEECLISNYLYNHYLVSDLFNKKSLSDCINLILDRSKTEPKYNKLLFRGTENNKIREKLFQLNGKYLDIKKNDHIDFLDFMDYKYILDIWGKGHSGRRFWLLLMNRVIFIPEEDENKLYFELGENCIKPNVHYISYSIYKLEELNKKVKYLEENPIEYKKIQNNCREYCNKYLKYIDIEIFIKNNLEETQIKRFTIFGERNSGTTRLIKNLKGILNLDYTRDFGFKHWYIKDLNPRGCVNNTTDNQCKRSIDYADDTIFIIIVRNPYNWFYSIYKNKNHIIKPTDESFIDFLKLEYVGGSKKKKSKLWIKDENQDYYFIESEENLVKLRNKKFNHFYNLKKRVKNFFIINLENLEEDVSNLIKTFKIPIKSNNFPKYISKDYSLNHEEKNFIKNNLNNSIDNFYYLN